MRSTWVDHERATFCCVTLYGHSLHQNMPNGQHPLVITARTTAHHAVSM